MGTEAAGTELHDYSGVELAQAIATGVTSSREATRALLDRIGALDGPINAVVHLDEERALAEADRADAAVAAGEALGPFHGVPMTVKDSYATEGMVTTSGAPMLAEHIPDADAAAVTAMRGAGAVIMGKTNLPLFAGDIQSYNEVYGVTNNPWDVSRTPGGSSGGAAAALAAGFTPLEIGSDIGGSIRIPSSNCGVVGHKPSFGIVPLHGHIPGPPGSLADADIAVGGPMARTVDDLEVTLDVLAGPDRWSTPGWRLDLPPARPASPVGLRVATWFDDPLCPVDADVANALQGTADALAEAGATVDGAERPFEFDAIVETFESLLMAALSTGFDAERLEHFAQVEPDSPSHRSMRRAAIRHAAWLRLHERRLQLRRRAEDFFTRWDVMLLPVLPCTAFPHNPGGADRTLSFGGGDRHYYDVIRWMAPAGACYLPATVVPIGLGTDGLPIGVQIVGPHLHDRTTLAVARMIAAAVEPIGTPPGF